MSCVVKCCKNRSDRRKKHPGITFHRFPKDNDPWRNDWIEIIKNCNGEIDWIPNKYSVICSIHFEDNDLYVTKGGLRRIVTYAIPQKFLFVSPHMVGEHNAAVNVLCTVVSGASEEIVPVTFEKSYPSTVVIKQEKQHADPNISSDLQESVPVTFEKSYPSTVVIKQEKEHADPNVSSDLQESAPVTLFLESYPSTVVIKQENQSADPIFSDLQERAPVTLAIEEYYPSTVVLNREEQPSDPISSDFIQKSSEVGTANEEMSWAIDSPRTRRLKNCLMKKQEFIKKQKRIIKTLKQKIKRLQDRNKSLKETLRSRRSS